MAKMTAGDWKGDTARGARYASEARARFYDKLDRQWRNQREKKRMRLTSAVVTELAVLRAEIKKKTEKEKELCTELKDEMTLRGIDEFAPAESPYKLVKVEYDQKDVSWKELAEEIYKKMFGARWRLVLRRAVKASGKKHVVCLDIKTNHRYKRSA